MKAIFWVIPVAIASIAVVSAQCEFSTLEPGPSAIEPKAPRTVFPVFGPNGTTSYIDRAGKRIQPPKDADGSGLTAFKDFVDGHPRYGYRDAKGVTKIDTQFLDALAFRDGLAGVEAANGNWGFVDISGTMHIAPKYHAVDDFHDGLAAVDLCGKCGYIAPDGKLASNATFRHCYRYSGNIAKVEVSKGEWGFIDKAGKVLARLSGDAGESALVSEGLMPSEKAGSNGIGFVRPNGEFVIPPRFAFVEPFAEGLAAVNEDGKWGYIDKSGKYAISPQFADPEDPRGGLFQEGLAFVTDEKTKLHGFINPKGEYMIRPQYGRCNDPSGQHCAFDGGLAWVETKTMEGYINPKGKFVWSTPVGRGRSQ
jgi:hypothetical protein